MFKILIDRDMITYEISSPEKENQRNNFTVKYNKKETLRKKLCNHEQSGDPIIIFILSKKCGFGYKTDKRQLGKESCNRNSL